MKAMQIVTLTNLGFWAVAFFVIVFFQSCSTSIHVDRVDARNEFLTFQPLPTPTPEVK